eukprot:TRINITY_DN24348_c0_g1_i2.p1 TRINITY_DN24348_c0_g1~~TRINITY_DN24348_c0_g1_i2.p1  ORF type:complete len:343 (-),score=49.12 TRINITY_DN24348_c0_g1_i2:248-1276(-)
MGTHKASSIETTRLYAANIARWFPEVLLALGAPDLDADCIGPRCTTVEQHAHGTTIEIVVPRQRTSLPRATTPVAAPANVSEASSSAADAPALLLSLSSLAGDFEHYAAALAAALPDSAHVQTGAPQTAFDARMNRVTDEMLRLTAQLQSVLQQEGGQRQDASQGLSRALASALDPYPLNRAKTAAETGSSGGSSHLLAVQHAQQVACHGPDPRTFATAACQTSRQCSKQSEVFSIHEAQPLVLLAADVVAASHTEPVLAPPAELPLLCPTRAQAALSAAPAVMQETTPRGGKSRQVRQSEGSSASRMGRARGSSNGKVVTFRKERQDLNIAPSKLDRRSRM